MSFESRILIEMLLVVALVVACYAAPVVSATGGGEKAATQPAGLGAPTHLRCEYLENPLGIHCTKPRFGWWMSDDRRGAAQTAYQILVASDAELLRAEKGDLWDTGKVASEQSIQVEYAGEALTSRRRAWWKVRVWDRDGVASAWSAPALWTMGLLERADWGDAKWIGDAVVAPPIPAAEKDASGKLIPPTVEALPPPMVRKEFAVAGNTKITRATVYVTALGLYELRMNGRRVGDRLLAPEWTDYDTRVQYQTYDVTELVRAGANAVGVQLGDGWYAGRIGLTGIVPGGPARALYGRQPKLLLRLEIERGDGTTQTVVSDASWKCTTDGPIRVGDLLDGETYDARKEMKGWDAAGFDDSEWKAVTATGIGELARGPRHIVAQLNEPIRVTKELKPIALTEPHPGVYIFDLGQNMVGWCRLKVLAPAGTTVKLRHAEVLNPDGTLYTANLRSAPQTDQYTARSDEPAVFEPHFTYHGFRYVEVTGLPKKPALEDLTGRVFHSSFAEAGRFECSEPLVNRLWQNAVWTQRANFMSVPTDCPQRDERLGWMGDILVFAPAGCFNMDLAAFFTKWLPDVRDAQADDGRFADFSPHPLGRNERFTGVPAWGDAGVFVPWTAYVNYADRRILAEQFESARRWVDWIHANNPELLWKNKRHNDYGDWLNADTLKLDPSVTGGVEWPKGAEVPKDVFGTMFFARSTELLARMAEVLRDAAAGEDKAKYDADVKKYGRLHDEIQAAFNKAYVGPDGRMLGNTQAGYAIALRFGLLPGATDPNAQPPQVAYMQEAFRTYHDCLSTGFLSTICLMRELSARGHNYAAYRLLLNKRIPSWLYPVEHGATTIWERWDGYVEGRGFQDPGMNSFAHYAFGGIGEWLFADVAGINPDESRPGYKHIIIRPHPGPGLEWARANYESIHGPILAGWKKEGGTVTFDVTIPANTTATVYLPAKSVQNVLEGLSGQGGQKAADARGVKYVRDENGCAVFDVAAGQYRFFVND